MAHAPRLARAVSRPRTFVLQRLASTSSITPAPPSKRRRPTNAPLFSDGLALAKGETYPDLLAPNSILDAFTTELTGHEGSKNASDFLQPSPKLTFYNSPSPFPRSRSGNERQPVQQADIHPRDRHKYVLINKRVVHQTGKGKVAAKYLGIVMGNGKGIVGFGDAKAEEHGSADSKAESNALKNCDYVDLFEGRTIWTDMQIKFGSTTLQLRPRPRGFGLMCNPYVHQVCKAAGIKDISAKVHGSRNGLSIIKATLMLLHSGGAPLAMGNGIGGRLRRESKKQGIKSQATMERERGREFVEGGSWI